MLRLFWLGTYVTPEHVQTAYKRPLNDHRKGLTQYTHDQRFMTTHAVVCFVQIPPVTDLINFALASPSTHKKDGNRLLEHIKNEEVYF